MDSILHDLPDQALDRPAAGIVEYRGFAFDLLSMHRVVTGGCCVTVRLDPVRIVKTENGLHQVRQRVVIKIG